MMIIMCEHNGVLQMTINRLERYTALGAGVFTVTRVVLDLVRSLQQLLLDTKPAPDQVMHRF